MSRIEEEGYAITAVQMFYIDHVNAEEFYEVYKGVTQEYSVICYYYHLMFSKFVVTPGRGFCVPRPAYVNEDIDFILFTTHSCWANYLIKLPSSFLFILFTFKVFFKILNCIISHVFSSGAYCVLN